MQGLFGNGHNIRYDQSAADHATPGVRGAGLRLVPPSRDQQILALRSEGRTLAEIGRRFGLSRQRVEQIVKRAGGVEVHRELTRVRRRQEVEARRALHTRMAGERSGEILERYRRGVDPQLIARDLGLHYKVVNALICERRTEADRAARAWALAGRLDRPRFSDKQLLDGVRRVAARVGRAPSGKEYERSARELGLASMPTVYGRFGGWGKALRAAGLESSPPSRLYSPRWHIAACWRALESVDDQLGDPPRYRRYLELAAERDDLPSAATLRVRLGLWPAIAAALMEYRARSGRRPTEAVHAPAANGHGPADRVPRPRSGGHQPVDGVPTANRAPSGDAGRLPSRLGVCALQHLAAHPGSSGRAVKRGLRIRHDSQASTLLTRLEREGLLLRQRNGAAAAWTLTERGRSVLRQLPEALHV